jgi:hypothetical protein
MQTLQYLSHINASPPRIYITYSSLLLLVTSYHSIPNIRQFNAAGPNRPDLVPEICAFNDVAVISETVPMFPEAERRSRIDQDAMSDYR